MRAPFDAALTASGWAVQSRDEINLSAAREVAIREFRMAPTFGVADYLLFALERIRAEREGRESIKPARRPRGTKRSP